MLEDGDELQHDILHNITAAVVLEIDDTVVDNEIELNMVVSANVEMIPISATNMPPVSYAFIYDEFVQQ